MKPKQLAALGVLVFCCIIPIGLIILLLNAIYVDNFSDSLLGNLLKELES